MSDREDDAPAAGVGSAGGSQGQPDADEEDYVYSEDEAADGVDVEMSDSEPLTVAVLGGGGDDAAAGPAARSTGTSPSAAGAGSSGASGAASSSAAGGAGAGAASSHHARAGRLSITSTGIGAASGQEYRLLRPEDVERERARVVHSLVGVLGVTDEAALLLLAHFKWNRERALDAYTGDPDAVAREVGLENFGQGGPPPAPFYCAVCMEDDVPSANGFQLGCK